MSTRLQVVLNDSEMREIQSVAQAQHLTVAEWVRQALRSARRAQPATDAERKIQCVRESATYGYPTGEVDEVLQDVERGRGGTGES
jgi:hypothetical protein